MIIQIIVLIILIYINGVFASSELAFLSLNKNKIKTMAKKKTAEGKKAKKIEKLIQNSSSFLATIQIGITLAGFLASAFAAEAFADQIVDTISITVISRDMLKTIIVILVTLILSYFTLVFGELVPKKIALTKSEKIAFKYVNMITILMKITYPFVWLLTASTNLITNILGVKENPNPKITEEEIKLMIAEGKDIGAIENGEKNLIYNVFKFNDIPIKKIMTKLKDMVCIENNLDKSKIFEIIKDTKYTRFPVYDGKINNIVGIFNVKELINNYSKENKVFNFDDLIDKEVMFVNQKEIVDDVFHTMQKSHKQMCIVIDDRRNVVGLVTMEDALEEIVGNIFDEYDE